MMHSNSAEYNPTDTSTTAAQTPQRHDQIK